MNTNKKPIVLEVFTSNISFIKLVNMLNSEDYKFVILESDQLETNANTHNYDEQLFGKKGLLILDLLSKGCSYKEIAFRLQISINGIRFHIKKIFKALNVNNGRDAVRIYLTEIKKASPIQYVRQA